MKKFKEYIVAEDGKPDTVDIVVEENPEKAVRRFIADNYLENEIQSDIVVWTSKDAYPKIDIKDSIFKYFTDNPDKTPLGEGWEENVTRLNTEKLQDLIDKWMRKNALYELPGEELYRFTPLKEQQETNEYE